MDSMDDHLMLDDIRVDEEEDQEEDESIWIEFCIGKTRKSMVPYEDITKILKNSKNASGQQADKDEEELKLILLKIIESHFPKHVHNIRDVLNDGSGGDEIKLIDDQDFGRICTYFSEMDPNTNLSLINFFISEIILKKLVSYNNVCKQIPASALDGIYLFQEFPEAIIDFLIIKPFTENSVAWNKDQLIIAQQLIANLKADYLPILFQRISTTLDKRRNMAPLCVVELFCYIFNAAVHQSIRFQDSGSIDLFIEYLSQNHKLNEKNFNKSIAKVLKPFMNTVSYSSMSNVTRNTLYVLISTVQGVNKFRFLNQLDTLKNQ